MFTGIIEKRAQVAALHRKAGITQMVLTAELATNHGDSIAVNGCCLTVTDHSSGQLQFDISSETLAITNLGELKPGSWVNLERAMPLGARLDGHLVSGHVDGLATLRQLAKHTDGWHLQVELSQRLGRQCIPKGSICLNGVSLTINSLTDHGDKTLLSLMLIPTTVNLTTFEFAQEGDSVNLEVDMIGKFVARLHESHRS